MRRNWSVCVVALGYLLACAPAALFSQEPAAPAPSTAPATEKPATEKPAAPLEPAKTETPKTETPKTEAAVTVPAAPAAIPSAAPAAAATPQDTTPSKPATTGKPAKDDTATAKTALEIPSGDRKKKLTFVYTPWKDVIEELAEWADLDIIADKYPQGTCFHRVQDREYTAQEAIDELNGQLLLRGFTLIVYERMLIVRDLADVLPGDLIPIFLPDELNTIGRYRVAKCVFSFSRFTPQELEAELRPIMANWGTLQVLPKLRQVVVTETGDKLRKIRDMLADDVNLSNFKAIPLRTIPPDEALSIIRVLMRFPIGQDSAADGSISVASDVGGMRLLVTGTPDKLKQLEDILKVLDPPGSKTENGLEEPILQVYPITAADPVACMKVLESMLVGEPGVRLGLDSTSNMITLLGSPTIQKRAKDTLDKLQGLTLAFEVIPLKRLSVDEAKALLDSSFGGGDSGTNKKAPVISSNPSTQQLYVRGTTMQIKEVREILGKLDALTDEKEASAISSKVRTIPLTGRSLDRALQQIDVQWNLTRKNRINVVYPKGMTKPEGIRSTTPGGGEKPEEKSEATENRSTNFQSPVAPKTTGKMTWDQKRSIFRRVSWQEPQRPGPVIGAPQDGAPPVTIHVTPNGIILSSDDTDALDELEALLLAIQNQQRSAVDDFTVIYLKHSKAEVTSELLREIIGGAEAVSGGGGGGLLGMMAQGALGQNAGGLMNNLMGGGGGGEPSAVVTAGPVTIVPDTRINALFVQAAPVDLDLVEQLVAVMDQEDGPQDPLIAGEPRVIPLTYAKAEDVAATIKASLPSDLFASANQGQSAQPNPQDLIRLLQGGGRGGNRGSASQRRQQEGPKITIGTNVANNWLVVTAPENLFKQVESLAIELDAGAQDLTMTTVQIVPVKRANAANVKTSIAAIMGLKTSGSTSSTASTTAQDDARRRAQQGGGNNNPGFPAGVFGGFPGGGAFGIPGGGQMRPGGFGGQGGNFGGGNQGGFGGGNQGGFGGRGGQGGGQGGGNQGGRGGGGAGGGRGGGGRGGAGT